MLPAQPAPRPYAALPILWALVMLVLTLTPAQEMPRTPEWKFLSFDTAAHAGVFAVLAVLGWFSLGRQRRWLGLAQHPGVAVLAGCVLFGGLIEVLQYAMQVGRHAEWSDLGGDSLGAALALGLVAGSRRWWLGRRAALLVLASLGLASPSKAQEVDLTRARRTIAALAAPNMHGRGYVQRGEHRAATYLRRRLRQLGLQPLAPDYTQSFALAVNTFPGACRLQLGGREANALQPGRDFIAAPESAPQAAARQFRLVPLDTLVFTDTAAVRRSLFSLRGSVPGLAASHNQPWLASYLPTAVVLRARDEARLAALPPALRQLVEASGPRLVLQPKLTASLASSQAPQVRLEVLASSWPSPAPATATVQLDATLERDYHTQNLAAVVRGSAQPDSFLVVSAHYDHLGLMGRRTYFPGANDNASGVALLLELASHYARPENRPACSVVFLLFGAEEAGLVGSTYFVQHPLVPLANIKFLMNLDLLGTGEEGATVVNGRLLPAAFQRLVAFNDQHHYLPRLTARGAAANSDHYPFSQAGVPAFFMYTRGGSLAYHDVHDQPAALSLVGFAGAYGLVRDFLNAAGAQPPL